MCLPIVNISRGMPVCDVTDRRWRALALRIRGWLLQCNIQESTDKGLLWMLAVHCTMLEALSTQLDWWFKQLVTASAADFQSQKAKFRITTWHEVTLCFFAQHDRYKCKQVEFWNAVIRQDWMTDCRYLLYLYKNSRRYKRKGQDTVKSIDQFLK